MRSESPMDIILIPLLNVLMGAITVYIWLLIIYVIMGWLEHFNVINKYNRIVFVIQGFLFRVIEPALAPIRKIIPNLGGLDISPIILILILNLLQGVMLRILLRFPG